MVVSLSGGVGGNKLLHIPTTMVTSKVLLVDIIHLTLSYFVISN